MNTSDKAKITKKKIVSNQDTTVWKKAHDFGIVGKSDGLYEAVRMALKLAPTEVPVIIIGSNGVGKQLIADLIHAYSMSGPRKMISINCAAIPSNYFESEMFGHEKGAFPGAIGLKKGAFELAHGSTLFLDDLGKMPPDQQVKLKRVIETGTCRRIGSASEEEIQARPRVIATVSADTLANYCDGCLVRDLFERLPFRIMLPQLNERVEDIVPLAKHFLKLFCANDDKSGKTSAKTITPRAHKSLEKHKWPGNIREMKGVIEFACITASSDSIDVEDLKITTFSEMTSPGKTTDPDSNFNVKRHRDNERDKTYKAALEAYRGNISAAAKSLGISRQALHKWKVKQG
jgi:DNA-binding NtrC family response regulator